MLANLWAQAAGEVYTAAEEAKVKERIKRTQQNHRDKTEVLRKKKGELQARRDLLGLEDPKVIDAKLQAAQAAQADMQTQEVAIDLDLKKLDVKVGQCRRCSRRPNRRRRRPRRWTRRSTATSRRTRRCGRRWSSC